MEAFFKPRNIKTVMEVCGHKSVGLTWNSNPEDVKDGLDKTIVLLQVPASQKTPWLAGGGATVRGVGEGPDAMRQFICADYQGKHGTFAVMGDGKVRFIVLRDIGQPAIVDDVTEPELRAALHALSS